MKKIYNINKEINKKKINTKYMQKNNNYNNTILNKNKNINEIKYNSRRRKENLIIHQSAIKKDLKNKILSVNKSKFIKFFSLFNVIISSLNLNVKCKKGNFLYRQSEIFLKINGTGNNNILSNDFFKRYNKCEIYINDSLQDEIKSGYDFNNSEFYNIKIKWNISISNTEKMFYNCKQIIEIDLSNFDTSQVTNMSYMFHNCSSLISLNLANFNTSQVQNMNRMFCRCSSLISLNLTNFDTSNVIDMAYMFLNCFSLESLDLTNFNTSKVQQMEYMFYYCLKLSSLIIINFDTSKVKDMNNMFCNCRKLESLNLSNFNTSIVENMEYMFARCFELRWLNLSTFNTSNVKEMNVMFYSCSSLSNLNLSNFDTSQVKNMTNMFNNCSSLTSLDLSNFNISKVNNMDMMFYNCSLLISLNLYNWDISKLSCSTNIFYRCKNLEYIYLNLSSIIIDINNIFDSQEENLTFCEENDTDYLINLFQTQNFAYSKIYDHEENIQIQYKSYMINPNSLCQHEMELSSFKNFTKRVKLIDNLNYYIDKIINNEVCYLRRINPYYKLSNYTCKACGISEENDKNWKSFCVEYNYNFIKKENKTEIIQNIINDLISDFNKDEFKDGKDKIIPVGNKIVILTSTLNQKINEDKYNVTMDLGECENKLKGDYNISINDSLYILQTISDEGMKIPKLEYEVYYPLYNNTLRKLNLSTCKDIKIEILISVKISGALDKYNPRSNYYNDICFITNSEKGTDISLKDRRNEFVDNNMSLCEENCDLIEYISIKEKAKCSCDIKLSIPSNYESKFNKEDFFKSFTDIKNIFNLNIIKCYKTVLKIKSLIKNYGFIIVCFIIILFFINLFIFIFISYRKIKEGINTIIFALKLNSYPIKKKQKNKKNNIKKRKCKINNLKKLNNKYKIPNNFHEQITQNNMSISFYKMNIKNNSITNSNKIYIYKILDKKDFELNLLNYEEAFIMDKRNYCEYYISLLKYNYTLLFSFGFIEDYNSGIIKMFLFYFFFNLDLAINALFFTDDTMHKIYQDKGKYNLLYQIPQILYSTLISRFFDSFIRIFALSQENIVQFKQEKNSIDINRRGKKLLKILKIKFTIFFILAFIILILLGYYITCFCGVYINTQIHLIKDTIISLIISLLVPFIIYLLIGIFRILSLKVEKPTRKLLYQFSSFLENWLC